METDVERPVTVWSLIRGGTYRHLILCVQRDGTWELPGGPVSVGDFNPVAELATTIKQRVGYEPIELRGPISAEPVTHEGMEIFYLLYDVSFDLPSSWQPVLADEYTRWAWLSKDDVHRLSQEGVFNRELACFIDPFWPHPQIIDEQTAQRLQREGTYRTLQETDEGWLWEPGVQPWFQLGR